MNAKSNNTEEKAQQLCEKLYLAAKIKTVESARQKIIGKPYEGKLHVRFDEGAEERFSALLYSPCIE